MVLQEALQFGEALQAEGVLHAAGIHLGDSGINTKDIGEEVTKGYMPLLYLLTGFSSGIGNRDQGVALLFDETRILKGTQCPADGSSGYAKALGNIDRANLGTLFGKLKNSFQIILTGSSEPGQNEHLFGS